MAELRADPQFARVRVELFDHEARVHGDADQLRILFSNLMLNAAQAMDGAGEVRIGAAVDGAGWRISVHDTGPGIPAEERSRVFEPFYTTRSRGTGLGLAIATQIVRGHHGEITIACPEGGGTEVAVTLPRS